MNHIQKKVVETLLINQVLESYNINCKIRLNLLS